MILGMMATDVALLAAALIVVSLVELGVGVEQFSVGSALRYERGVRLARGLRVLVATSVVGFIAGILTIWLGGQLIRILTVVLGTAATIEFGIMTIVTLELLLSRKTSDD
jgi:hypothetical protein